MDSIFLDNISAEDIFAHCILNNSNEKLRIHVFESINSTNDYLKKLPYQDTIEMCCANTQTQGRGRLGRKWHSPPKGNMYCSIRWKVSCSLSQLPPLSIVSALAVIAALQSLGISEHIQIKWPNDLYWHEKKLGGILIESVTEKDGKTLVVIGIGLNINIQSQLEEADDKIERPWCSLRDITHQSWCRNTIIGSVFTHLDRYLKQYTTHGLKPFMLAWEKVDWLSGQQVSVVLSNTQQIQGIACGMTERGLLCVRDSEGKIEHIASGEIMRLAYESFPAN